MKNPEIIQINEDVKILNVKRACIDNSVFEDVSATGLEITDANLTGLKITDANLTGIEINNAQLGGSYIHDVGVTPPKGHPAYDENVPHKPIRFGNCDLRHTTFNDCNLSGVTIHDCNIQGMKIFGIAVEDLFKAYQKSDK